MGSCQSVNHQKGHQKQHVRQQTPTMQSDNGPKSSSLKPNSKKTSPLMFCPNSHPLRLMCTDRNCDVSALFCQDKNCSYGIPSHSECSRMELKEVVSIIQERSKYHDLMMKKMHDIQTFLINQIIAKRRKHFDEIFLKMKDSRFANIVNRIYYNKQEQLDLRGSDAWEFVQKLQDSNARIESIQDSCLEDYDRDIKELANDLVQIQRTVMTDYAQRIKIRIGKRSQSSISSMPSAKACNLELDSVLIKDNFQLAFLEQELSHPKKVQLLFRASEHEFKAEKFHEICDNIPHTLCIIRTEFNKTIAGYTPLTWNSAQGFSEDPTRTSFLLSMELGQRMDLQKPQKAIQCIPNYGPVFGGGCDLAICDSCNINGDSCTNFAYSYNWGERYDYSQKSWWALCGVEQGKYFKVLQYEVFKVTW